MTPQAFSYATLSNNGFIYVPPFGLTESIDYMLKMDPATYKITKIQLNVNSSCEKWQHGIVYRNKIYFLPYNEENILVVNTDNDSIEYIKVQQPGKGKYIQGHIYRNKIIALPYGEHSPYEYVLKLDLDSHEIELQELKLPRTDCKKWHTTQLLDGVIYGLPRGEDWENYFPYRIHYDCTTSNYEIIDMSPLWLDYDTETFTNKKFTTLAKVGRKLFAPPYSENPNFDVLTKFIDGEWFSERTGLKATSRKYYTHTVARNGKIFFPPAGHDNDWSSMLVIDSDTDKWHTIELGISKESKKYFAGVENSQNKIYYIPRGGCVCEPTDTWKKEGDLAEVLVVDTISEQFYTIDISEYFKDSTTIEKYNNCIIKDNIIYAFPYGQSNSFQTVLVFDTIKEKIIHTRDLNDL